MPYPLWSKNTRVFIDTSSLMEDASGTFMWRLAATLREKSIPPLIVAKSVVDELNRLEADEDECTSCKARNAKSVVSGLLNEEDAQVVGDKDDGSFADNLFQTVFTRFRLKYRLILITQDRGLAKDILSLNGSASVDGICGIDAFRLRDSGTPMGWKLNPGHPSGVAYRETRQRATQLDETPVAITSIPGPGDVVKDEKGSSLHLGDRLGSGGEGTVYETDNGLVCKVYQPQRFKGFTIDKIKLMTSRRVRHQAICWPVSLAYNSRGEAVGYLMPRGQGKELQRTVFIPPLLQKTFPHWTRRHLVKLTSTILNAVASLHSLNVLLGDINARNILVQDESTVFFVDCDSYQVEGFPCPVGMPPYLAPELYGKELRSTLRTLEHEQFAIATLVFMLLHPGKPPYSHQGGGDPSENVRKRHFPYQRGSQGAHGAPAGAWRFIFSNLPWRMKDAFHKVFSDDKRLSIVHWQDLMRRYEDSLGKGDISDELFPKGFKQIDQTQAQQQGVAWRMCEVCGQGFAAYEAHFTKCYTCKEKRHAERTHHSWRRPD